MKVYQKIFLVGLATFALATGFKIVQVEKKGPDFKKIFESMNRLTSPVIASDPPTAIGTLRSNIFLIVGYPSDAVYAELTGGEGGPQDGLIGFFDEIRRGLSTVISATSCADIPATGSDTGSVDIDGTSTSVSITYATPTAAPPTGFTGAGTTYAKKLTATAGTYEIAVEFNCDRQAAFVTLELPTPGDGYTGATRTLNFYFDLEDEDARKLEFAMTVTDDNNECGGQNTCEVWLMRAQTGASSQFSLWQSSFAWRGTKFQGERVIINGNYESQEMSSFYTFESDFGATLESVTGTDQSATTTTDFDFSSATTADLVKQGCIDYDTPSATLTSSTVCTGYSLEEPSASSFVSGDSVDFTYTGLKDLPDNLETL